MQYGPTHRALQDQHDSRRLADLMAGAIVHAALTSEECAFITAQDMFFLATVDAQGRPTTSYKGGARGFVHVEDGAIVFPCYDGNGMFYSMGNLAAHAEVGLLFIDFATPNRLRVQGRARIDDGEAKAAWPGALFVVRVEPTEVFPNCARYVHRRVEVGASGYVPDADGHAPVPAWKRIDIVESSLPATDRAAVAEAVAEAGAVTMDEYARLLSEGRS